MYADLSACALIVCCAAFTGCGGDSADLTPVRLIHSPPISALTPQQLRSLSMDCEKYSPNATMRGPYDAAYCDDAMAAWADAPLQMVPIPANSPAHPKQ